MVLSKLTDSYFPEDYALPRIIEYLQVRKRLQPLGLRCVYYNSGAFAFQKDVATRSIGWIGPDDPTLRAEARALTIPIPAPYEANLARLLVSTWREHIDTPAWVMPASHWAFELRFGSGEWMMPLLKSLDIDAAELQDRTDASAIEFETAASDQLERIIRGLLENLEASDFSIVFPDRPAICTLHHHKQLWWTTSDRNLHEKLVSAASDGFTTPK